MSKLEFAEAAIDVLRPHMQVDPNLTVGEIVPLLTESERRLVASHPDALLPLGDDAWIHLESAKAEHLARHLAFVAKEEQLMANATLLPLLEWIWDRCMRLEHEKWHERQEDPEAAEEALDSAQLELVMLEGTLKKCPALAAALDEALERKAAASARGQ